MILHRVEKLYVQNNMASIIECFHIKKFDIQVSECGKIFRNGLVVNRKDVFISIEKTLIKKINLFASVFHPDKFKDGYFASLIDADRGFVSDNLKFTRVGYTGIKEKKTLCVDTGIVFKSATEAGFKMGFKRNCVARAARKSIPHHKGYTFEYL